MKIEIIRCPHYLLEERLTAFERTATIEHIDYLLENSDILAIVHYTISKAQIKLINKERKKQKADELKKKMKNREVYL